MLDVSRDRVPTLRDPLRPRRPAGGLEAQPAPAVHRAHLRLRRPRGGVARRRSLHAPTTSRPSTPTAGRGGVELVANQNTLGHFERWLRHDRYRPLAIAPDGFEWVFGIHRPPLTLDPAKPDAFALVSDLLAQLVPRCASRRGSTSAWTSPGSCGPERHGEWVALAARACAALPVLAGTRAARVGRRARRAPRPAGRAPRRRHRVRVGLRGQPPLRRARRRAWPRPGCRSGCARAPRAGCRSRAGSTT